MVGVDNIKGTPGFSIQFLFFFCLFLFMGYSQNISAEGVFEKKQKARHSLYGADLKRIKAEHQLKFGKAKGGAHFKSNNPWEKKKKKSQRPVNKAQWGECRDYALQKRNRCYREGRNAYRCEQMYEARARLCDNEF